MTDAQRRRNRRKRKRKAKAKAAARMDASRVVICGHCGEPAEAVRVAEIYPNRHDLHRSLANKWWWRCEPCNAYVGCHEDTRKPLGTLADPEEREWRKKAHTIFDRLWKSGRMERGDAYAWLQEALESPVHIHIGESGMECCQKIIAVAQRKWDELRSVR